MDLLKNVQFAQFMMIPNFDFETILFKMQKSTITITDIAYYGGLKVRFKKQM